VHVGPVPKLFLLGLRSKERCPNHAVILPPCHVKDPIFRFLLAEHAARWSSAVTAFFDLCLCPPAVLPCRFLGPRSAPAIFRSCRRFLFAQHYFSVRIFLLRQGFVLVTVFFFHARVPVRAARDLCFPHRFLAAGQFPLILFACLGVERSAPVFCSHCHVLVSTDEDFVPAYPAPKIFVFPHSGFRSRGSPRHRASCCQFDLEFFFYGVLLPSRFCLLAHLCSGFVGSSLQ
jgi:hypothetical protein